MRLIQLPDGTYLKARSPIEGVPFYSDWLQALLERHAAFRTTKRNRDTGHDEPCIRPYDRWQEQACETLQGGTIGIFCLGCGTPTPKMDLSRIRVGGRVQFSLTEPCDETIGDTHIVAVRLWRQRNVSKMGWGCQNCMALYMTESARVAQLNRERSDYVDCVRQMYMDRKDWASLSRVASPKEDTPFLDILTGHVVLRQFSEAMSRAL